MRPIIGSFIREPFDRHDQRAGEESLPPTGVWQYRYPMKRTAKILAVCALVLFCSQSCKLCAKDKDNSAATGDEAASNLKMLQGKWQAVDDKSDFLVFENNHRKEKAGGETEWDDEVFVLTDKPMREGKQVSDHKAVKAGFIYCEKDDMCWAIAELTARKLSLVYMGRGRVLEYRRVK